MILRLHGSSCPAVFDPFLPTPHHCSRDKHVRFLPAPTKLLELKDTNHNCQSVNSTAAVRYIFVTNNQRFDKMVNDLKKWVNIDIHSPLSFQLFLFCSVQGCLSHCLFQVTIGNYGVHKTVITFNILWHLTRYMNFSLTLMLKPYNKSTVFTIIFIFWQAFWI